MGMKIEFTPAYSLSSNGTNERNHYSADVILMNIMGQDNTISLEDAVSIAGWTHNTNANKDGFTPLTLATEKIVILLEILGGNIVTESLNDDESVRRIIERINYIIKM